MCLRSLIETISRRDGWWCVLPSRVAGGNPTSCAARCTIVLQDHLSRDHHWRNFHTLHLLPRVSLRRAPEQYMTYTYIDVLHSLKPRLLSGRVRGSARRPDQTPDRMAIRGTASFVSSYAPCCLHEGLFSRSGWSFEPPLASFARPTRVSPFGRLHVRSVHFLCAVPPPSAMVAVQFVVSLQALFPCFVAVMTSRGAPRSTTEAGSCQRYSTRAR